MHEDNIFLVSFRTMMIALVIIFSIMASSPILFLSTNMLVFEIDDLDFECDDLLELKLDWFGDLYYQDCLVDKDATAKTIHDHIILFFSVVIILLIALPCMFFGFFILLTREIKLLYKTNWITASTKFKFGDVDPEHRRKIMGK